MSGVFEIEFGILALALIPALYTGYRIYRSLKKLSKDVDQPRIASSANFLALGVAIGAVGSAYLFWAIFTGIFAGTLQSPSGSSVASTAFGSSFLFTSFWPIELVVIAAGIVEAIGAYFGYSGSKLALGNITSYPTPPSGPYSNPSYPTSQEQINFCPQCGQKTVNPYGKFCSNCGRPLRP